MAKSTLYNDVLARASLPVAVRTAAATVNGTGVDKADPSGGYDGFTTCVMVAVAGTITDGTHTIVLQDSDDNATFAAAAATDIQGGPIAWTTANANNVAEIGYTGGKRYVRASVTTAGATSGGTFGAIFILGGETSTPVKR